MENNSNKNYNEQRWSLTKSIRIQHSRTSEWGTVAESSIREAQMLRKTPRYIVDRVVRQTLRNWIAAGNRASNWKGVFDHGASRGFHLGNIAQSPHLPGSRKPSQCEPPSLLRRCILGPIVSVRDERSVLR